MNHSLSFPVQNLRRTRGSGSTLSQIFAELQVSKVLFIWLRKWALKGNEAAKGPFFYSQKTQSEKRLRNGLKKPDFTKCWGLLILWTEKQSEVFLIYLINTIPQWLSRWSIHLQCRRCGFNSWSRRSPGEGNGNPLQYSCPGNPMDRGASIVLWSHKESDTA